MKAGLAFVGPLSFTAVRFTVGGLLVLAAGRAVGVPIHPPPLRPLLIATFIGVFVNQIAWAVGLSLTTAVDASILLGLSPLAAAALMFAVNRRALPVRQFVGLIIGLVSNALVINASALGYGGSLMGNLLALTVPVTWSVYMVAIGGANRYSNAYAFTGWTAALGGVSIGIVALASGPADDWGQGWPAVTFGAVLASGVCYPLYFWAIGRLGVVRSSMYWYFQPLLGAIAASLLLLEPFGLTQFLGTIGVVSAAYLGAWSRPREESGSPTPG
jgi:drug/metabolite transporter (DMT)-like permease